MINRKRRDGGVLITDSFSFLSRSEPAVDEVEDADPKREHCVRAREQGRGRASSMRCSPLNSDVQQAGPMSSSGVID